MADINELEKRIAKLEEGFNKISSILIEALDEKKTSAMPTVEAVAPHQKNASGYLVQEQEQANPDVDESDNDAFSLGVMMAEVDSEKAAKIERQSSMGGRVQ